VDLLLVQEPELEALPVLQAEDSTLACSINSPIHLKCNNSDRSASFAAC
jgi:hypothetical protein